MTILMVLCLYFSSHIFCSRVCTYVIVTNWKQRTLPLWARRRGIWSYRKQKNSLAAIVLRAASIVTITVIAIVFSIVTSIEPPNPVCAIRVITGSEQIRFCRSV